jgi:hypothetical protein
MKSNRELTRIKFSDKRKTNRRSTQIYADAGDSFLSSEPFLLQDVLEIPHGFNSKEDDRHKESAINTF